MYTDGGRFRIHFRYEAVILELHRLIVNYPDLLQLENLEGFVNKKTGQFEITSNFSGFFERKGNSGVRPSSLIGLATNTGSDYTDITIRVKPTLFSSIVPVFLALLSLSFLIRQFTHGIDQTQLLAGLGLAVIGFPISIGIAKAGNAAATENFEKLLARLKDNLSNNH